MPETIGQAREAIRADVDGERLAAQAFLRDASAMQTLDAVRQERIVPPLPPCSGQRTLSWPPRPRISVENDRQCWPLFANEEASRP